MAAASRNTTAKTVALALKDFEADKKPHDLYADNVDRWYRAYRALFETRSKAAEWTSKQHPGYAFQVVETLTANVVDPMPRWRVRPYPRMTDHGELDRLREGAKANQLLLQQQLANPEDPFALKQVPFAKQAFIAQQSVFKVYWRYEKTPSVRQAVRMEDRGGVQVPVLAEEPYDRVKDDWAVDVVDVRDWFPHEGAVSLDKAQRVTHRCWYSFDELKRMEARGAYGVDAGGEPVDKLKESRDFSAEASNREQELFQTDRTKDKIEVLEQWRREPDGSLRVIAVANRAVLIRDTPSPFRHGRFPFVTCSPIPDLGRIPGIGVIEMIADLQEAAWSFLNQRIDSTELLANPIWGVRADQVDNLDQVYDRFPGATVEVDGDPNQVIRQMDVNPLPAELSLQAEDRLKRDLQDIPGASPTLLGQTDQSAQTATEVSLQTSLAQRRIALMKQQFKWAYKQVGEQALALNQQFVTQARLVEQIGRDGAAAFTIIHPLLIQGDFYLEIDSLDESLMRQERRAEAQAKLQVALQAVQFFAALPNQPGLNLQAFMDDLLEAYDIQDTSRYYGPLPTPPQQQPQLPGPQQQGQPGPPQPGGGITAPQAYNATAPSNATSMSPLAALQRMGAMAGGPVNIGG